jgi:transcription elongation factor Elf1
MTQKVANNTPAQSPETTTSNGKLQFPCSLWTLVKAMVALGWAFMPILTADKKPTRMPRLFTCPNCRAHWLKQKKSEVFAKRLATKAVVFFKTGKQLAVCPVCGWRHSAATDAPSCAKEADSVSQKVEAPQQVESKTCQKPGCNRPLPKGKKKYCEVCVPFKGQAAEIDVY